MGSLIDPERELALSYAPPETRPALRLLWAFDEKLGGIVAGTSESQVGEMRLLWWREAIEGLGTTVPDEPLLAAIAEDVPGAALDPARWGLLAEGWFALLAPEVDRDDLDLYAVRRGARLFALSAELLAGPNPIMGVEEAGSAWALIDLACNCSDAGLAREAVARGREKLVAAPPHWPKALRPLGALTAMARRDARTGGKRRQGSPSRVARMGWHRLTGR